MNEMQVRNRMKQKSSQDTRLSGETTENKKSPNSLDSFNQMSLWLKQVGDQWSQAAQALGKQFEQIISEASNLVQQAISQKVQETTTAIVQPISEGMQRFRNIDPAFLKAVKQKLDQIMSDMKQVHPRLAQRVWFLLASEKVPGADMIALVLCLETGTKEVDEFMAKWVEDKLPAIQEILIEYYPTRKEEIEAAFRAHDRGEYLLSIPVFLRLSDGVYFDQSSGKYEGGVCSKKKNKNGKTGPQQFIDDLNVPIDLRYLFEPGGMITPLNVRTDQIVDPDILNRHAVAHGLPYAATKLNSLRAISWLLYWGTFTDEAPTK
jgi:hypothetical protein